MLLELVNYVPDDADATFDYTDAEVIKILWIKLRSKLSVGRKGEKVMLAGQLTSTVNLDDGQNFRFESKIYVIVGEGEGLHNIGFFTYSFSLADLE